MKIGKPLRKVTVEPVQDPVPRTEPKPAPTPAPVPDREVVKV